MDITSPSQVQGNYLEKSNTALSVAQPIDLDGPIVQDWTDDEERRVKRKYVKQISHKKLIS